MIMVWKLVQSEHDYNYNQDKLEAVIKLKERNMLIFVI